MHPKLFALVYTLGVGLLSLAVSCVLLWATYHFFG